MPSSPAAIETRRCAPSERTLSFASSSPWRPVVGRVRAVTRVEARRRKGHGALWDRPAPRGGGRGEVGGSPPAAPQPRAASRRTSPWTARPSWGLVAISARGGGGDLQYTNQSTSFLPSPWSRRVLSGYFNARAGADGGGPADVPRATGRQWARACGIGEEGRGAQLLGPARVVQHLRRGVVDGMLPHTPLYTHAQWARSTRKPALLPAHTSRHVPVVTDASWRLPRGRRRSVGRATQGRGAEQKQGNEARPVPK